MRPADRTASIEMYREGIRLGSAHPKVNIYRGQLADVTKWVWSEAVAHEPLVSVEDFEAARRIQSEHGAGRKTRDRQRVRRTYVIRGLLLCGLCGRKMQGQYSHGQAYYRCRYPNEYALANHVEHPRNVYLLEQAVTPALDDWLLRAFSPHRLTDTIDRLHAAQPSQPVKAVPKVDNDLMTKIAECDAKLARYRAIAEAGGDRPPSPAGLPRSLHRRPRSRPAKGKKTNGPRSSSHEKTSNGSS